MSSNEASALAEAFKSAADPTAVDYEKFSDMINEVFTIKGLQNNPSLKVHLPLHEGYPDRLGWHKEGLTPVERARVKEVLESLAHTCASEGIDFSFLLAGYDHHKIGVITRNNFTRAIYPLLRRETPRDAVLLARAYSMKDNQHVAYKVRVQGTCFQYSHTRFATAPQPNPCHPRTSSPTWRVYDEGL